MVILPNGLDGTSDDHSGMGTDTVTDMFDVAANVELNTGDDSDSDEDEIGVDVTHTPEMHMRDIDRDEVRKVDAFFEEGCGCALFNGRGCCYAFTREHITSIRDQCSSFKRHDLQNILFGHVMATVKASDIVENRGHDTKNRERMGVNFMHEGMKVNSHIIGHFPGHT